VKNTEIEARIREWLEDSLVYRNPKTKSQLRKELGIKTWRFNPIFSRIEEEVQTQTRDKRRSVEKEEDLIARENAIGLIRVEREKLEANELADLIKRMDAAVYKAATENKIAKMAELWYKRQGLLVDKKEETHNVNLNIAQLIREIEAEESGSGVQKVQKGLPLLPANLCLPSGQGTDSNSQV